MQRDERRDRVEVLFRFQEGFLVELLADPRWPDSVGKLRCPGGAIEAGEFAEVALCRELEEEYNIFFSPLAFGLPAFLIGPRGLVLRYEADACIDWLGKVQVEGGGETLVYSKVAPEPWV